MHLTELLNKILRLFKKYNDGTCELDVLKTLQTIDFEDLEALETFLDFYLAVEKNTSLNDNYIETIDVTNNIKEDIININNIKKKL